MWIAFLIASILLSESSFYVFVRFKNENNIIKLRNIKFLCICYNWDILDITKVF